MRWTGIGGACLCALTWAAGAFAATQDAVLTAVQGEASLEDRALGERATLADDQALATGEESGCSVLLDQSAVVELCGDTRISFGRSARRGNRVINVEAGEVRLIVEPRDADERIEIHTPAAIATILGTVVYVSVDPATGETTISSSESRVNIRERDEEECTPIGLPAEPGIPACAEGTTIGDLEQLTLTPGEGQREVQTLSHQQIADLGGCLLDFHELALEADRRAHESRATDRAAELDIAAVDPEVFESAESESEAESAAESGVESGADPETELELEPTDDASQEEEIIDDLLMEPPACGPIPGDHCDF